MDEFTYKHMCKWLDSKFGVEVRDTDIHTVMLAKFKDDPEFYLDRGWDRLFDDVVTRGFWFALRGAQDAAMDEVMQ